MKIADVAKLTPAERLLYWMQERESIRLKRVAGEPRPWTDDEILQRYRFCNVRRMDDKVSQWLLKNWYKPYKNHLNMLVACALARFINLPESLKEIGFPEQWYPCQVIQQLWKRRAQGRQVFNGAYIVSTSGISADKIEHVINQYVSPLAEMKDVICDDSMEQTWNHLLKCYGISSFMAGQIVADLRWAITGKWVDKMVWAAIGPGSRRGINRLLDLPINNSVSVNIWVIELERIIKLCKKQLDPDVTRRLEAIDYQNCLCEFDKYSRVLLGEGRPKQLYNGAGE